MLGVRSNHRFEYRERLLWVFSREGGSVIYSGGQGVRLAPRAIPEVTLDVDALAAGEL